MKKSKPDLLLLLLWHYRNQTKCRLEMQKDQIHIQPTEIINLSNILNKGRCSQEGLLDHFSFSLTSYFICPFVIFFFGKAQKG